MNLGSHRKQKGESDVPLVEKNSFIPFYFYKKGYVLAVYALDVFHRSLKYLSDFECQSIYYYGPGDVGYILYRQNPMTDDTYKNCESVFLLSYRV